MSDLHDDVYDRIREFKAAGFEPDHVVIPSDEWDELKNAAEVNEGEGYAGGDETLINGVRAVWLGSASVPEIVFKEGGE